MHRILSAFICLSVGISLATSCAAPEPPPPGALTLKVLTYNIHHGEGTDGVFDLERLAEVITASDADVVFLQEVDVRTARAGGVDQAAELGRLTQMQSVFAEAMPYDGGSYGEALLSRVPIASHEVLPLPASDNHEPRAALIAVLQPTGWPFPVRIAGTHLDHTEQDTDRLAQVAALRRQLEKGALPTLLVGDLNATPESVPMARLFSADWLPADPDHAPTFPADKPTRKIDWILLSPASAGRLMDPQVLVAPVASDHAPFLATWVFD